MKKVLQVRDSKAEPKGPAAEFLRFKVDLNHVRAVVCALNHQARAVASWFCDIQVSDVVMDVGYQAEFSAWFSFPVTERKGLAWRA